MASPTTVNQLLVNFKKRSNAGAYKHFRSRSVIATQIMDRINLPGKIDQGYSSLCGPASLLYNIAKKYPLVYAKYIIDLYETGKAKLGSLEVKPGTDNKNYNLPTTSGMSQVDWIGLAGLRDSQNDFFDYQSHRDQVAGITMPGELLSWFTKAGFTNGVNDTNIIDDEDLTNLLKAHQKKQAGHTVCLFVGANAFSGSDGGRATADHWVVLNSPILVDNKSVQSLLAKGKTVKKDKALLSKKLTFNVYTWGDAMYPVNKQKTGLTVEHFLDYFYGYISVK